MCVCARVCVCVCVRARGSLQSAVHSPRVYSCDPCVCVLAHAHARTRALVWKSSRAQSTAREFSSGSYASLGRMQWCVQFVGSRVHGCACARVYVRACARAHVNRARVLDIAGQEVFSVA